MNDTSNPTTTDPLADSATEATTATSQDANPTAPGFEMVDRQVWKEAQDALRLYPETRDRMVRMQADFDNFRKRLSREREDSVRYANESLLETLLPIMGLQAAETATDAKTIAMGLQMVKAQFQRFLSESGVEEINAVGAPFDPHLHEAIAQEPSTEHAEGTVLAQRRKGYKLRDRLLRPATVIVAAAAETASR
jgi:molecular chaperone GrpE